MMRKLLAKRWFRRSTRALAAFAIVGLCACAYFRVWSVQSFRAYREVRQYPPGEALWFGRYKHGDDLAAFEREFPRQRELRLGPFLYLRYSTKWPLPPGVIAMEGLGVYAKDGHLVAAGAAGCTWNKVFFEMSAEDEAEFRVLSNNAFRAVRVRESARTMRWRRPLTPW